MKVIDVHAHVVPPTLVDSMRAADAPDGIRIEQQGEQPWVVHRQGYRYPLMDEFHDVGARLSAMDRAGIDMAILSTPPTLFLYWIDGVSAADAAAEINDSVAAMVAQAPSRFRGLATLPLQSPEAAVQELRRSVEDLRLAGAQIGPHVEGQPLDHGDFRQVLEAAERLGVPLVVHPYYVGSAPDLDDFYLTNLQGNPWQTAVCASRLILSGTLDALPSLDLVLVHGGGHLIYQIGRLDHGYRVRPEAKAAEELPSAYLRRFHYDTLTHRPESTGWLIEQVGADRVLFGTDMPFDMAGGSLESQVAELQLGQGQLDAVAHTNAERIFLRMER